MHHYECHITTRTSFSAQATTIATELHWKTSEIARDPVLGEDTYFYLTTHDSDAARMKKRMDECVARLKEAGVQVLREKIEEIIHDTKLGLTLNVDSAGVSTRINPMAAWPFPRSRTGDDNNRG